MPRPNCVHCGEAYGQRSTTTETVKWRTGQDRPAYRGNGVVVREHFHGVTPSQASMRAVVPFSPNPAIRAVQEKRVANLPEESENVAVRTIWDGESYTGGYAPFCTLRCALDYARKAYARTQASAPIKAVR